MAKTEYDHIYTQLRSRIESGAYPYQDLLTSGHTLIKEFDCPRNAVHRAIDRLADEGYVRNIHGKGMQVIYQPQKQSEFFLSDVESMKEAVARNKKFCTTQVVCFTKLTVGEKVQVRTTFPSDEQIYYIRRVRYIDGEALVIDHNYLPKCVVKSLTPEVAQKSIHEYMEQELGESIVTTKRKMTIERMNQIDEKYLDMKRYNYMTVVNSMVCNAQDIMFELTQSRHRPDRFVFYDLTYKAKRKKTDYDTI